MLHHVMGVIVGVVVVVPHVLNAWGIIVVVAHHVRIIILASIVAFTLPRHVNSQDKCICGVERN